MRWSERAKLEGVHYQTAWRWFRPGQLPGPAVRTTAAGAATKHAIIHARVSSHDQRGDLERQVVVPDGKFDHDLGRDTTAVTTSSCARRHGRGNARNRAEKALGCAQRDVAPGAFPPPLGSPWAAVRWQCVSGSVVGREWKHGSSH